jgi:hypothetical protein
MTVLIKCSETHRKVNRAIMLFLDLVNIKVLFYLKTMKKQTMKFISKLHHLKTLRMDYGMLFKLTLTTGM